MRKVMPYVNEGRVVTPQARLLLAMLLCSEELISIDHAAPYAGVPRDSLQERVESLRIGDPKVWALLKDEFDTIHHACVVDQDKLGVTGIDFPTLWHTCWSGSIYGSSQNLIVMQAYIRHHVLTIEDDGLDKITHAVALATHDVYCAAGKFDRTLTVVINGKLLRDAVSIL